MLFDDSLMRFEIVFPAAGTPTSMVRMRRDDLLGHEPGSRGTHIALARELSES